MSRVGSAMPYGPASLAPKVAIIAPQRLPLTSTAFGRALRDVGIAGQKSGGVIFYPLVLLNG